MSPWTYSQEHSRLRFWVLVGYLTLVMLLCAFGLWKVQDQQDQLHRNAISFANRICVASNSARQSLYDLLNYAEVRVKQQAAQGGATKNQVDNAIDFYEKAKARIEFTDCPPPLEDTTNIKPPPASSPIP